MLVFNFIIITFSTNLCLSQKIYSIQMYSIKILMNNLFEFYFVEKLIYKTPLSSTHYLFDGLSCSSLFW